jgi:NAD(P)-dependent dehydrogenase (short-subunit alcohol dehydrogenase family)
LRNPPLTAAVVLEERPVSVPTAVVTGASSGIGAASSRQLAAHGFRVYAVARRAERLAALTAGSDPDPLRPGITAVPADLTDDLALVALVQRVVDETGRVDVLVNNAGYGAYGAVEDVPTAQGRAQFEVNLFAPARLAQLCLPVMRRRGAGRIVNVGSIGGKVHEPLGGWYHATKFALEGLSDVLRVELRQHGVLVSLVQPGAVATEWGDGAVDTLLRSSRDGAYAAQAAGVARVLAATARNPRRASPPEGVAAVVVAAATSRRPRARYVVGAGARPLLLLRHWLPDRAFDALVLRMFRPEPVAAVVPAR